MTDRPDWERLDWDRLIQSLDAWSSAAAVAPDRIRVTWEDSGGAPREVEILMSPNDFSDLTGPIWGDFEGAAQQVRDSLDSLPADHQFLIYKTCELHPSKTATLPEDPDEIRMREFMREHPEGGGNWFAIDKQGNLIPFPEGPPKD